MMIKNFLRKDRTGIGKMLNRNSKYSTYENRIILGWQYIISQQSQKFRPSLYLKAFFNVSLGSPKLGLSKISTFDAIKICQKMFKYLISNSVLDSNDLEVVGLAIKFRFAVRFLWKRVLIRNLNLNPNLKNLYSIRKIRHALKIIYPDEQFYKLTKLFEKSNVKFREIPPLPLFRLDGTKLYSNNKNTIKSYDSSWIKKTDVFFDCKGRILSEQEILINDPGADLLNDFVAGFWESLVSHPSNSKMVTVKKIESSKRIISSEAIIGFGRCASNYWHCVMEYIPALVKCVIESGCNTVVWSESSPISTTKLLRILLPKINFIFLKEGEVIHLKEAVIPVFGTTCFDSSVALPSSLCGLDTENILSTYSSLRLNAHKSGVERFLLIRSSDANYGKKLLNYDKLIYDANLLGLNVIDPARLSIQEQVKIFQSGDEIWSFGGSVWANLVFAGPKTRFINIVTNPMSIFLVHRYFALINNLNMKTFVIGNREPFDLETFRDYMHVDLEYQSGDLIRINNLIN